MLFYYIRHGTPTYKPDDLTIDGELQAKVLAEKLSLEGIDKIFSSVIIIFTFTMPDLRKNDIVNLPPS